MNAETPETTFVDRAVRQTDPGNYDHAWDAYHEFRESLDDREYATGTIQTLNQAERTAEESFRAGRVGFESDMNTLLYIARRVVVGSETTPEASR